MKIKKDYLVGGILVALGIAAMLLSLGITVKTNSTDPGSRLFPMLASGLLTLCGIGVLFSAPKSKDTVFLTALGWKKLLISFGCLVVYIMALKYLGFLVSSPLFLYAMVTILADGKKIKLWKKILYAVILTGISWFVFQNLLAMSLPTGKLF